MNTFNYRCSKRAQDLQQSINQHRLENEQLKDQLHESSLAISKKNLLFKGNLQAFTRREYTKKSNCVEVGIFKKNSKNDDMF
jgi:hypothetical protein